MVVYPPPYDLDSSCIFLVPVELVSGSVRAEIDRDHKVFSPPYHDHPGDHTRHPEEDWTCCDEVFLYRSRIETLYLHDKINEV